MPILSFIPSMLAAILGLIAAISLIYNNRAGNILGSLGRKLGLNKQMTLIVFAVVFLFLAGGFGVVAGWFTSAGQTATTVSTMQPDLPETSLDKCLFVAGDSQASDIVNTTGATVASGIISIRSDPNSNNKVYVDIDESAWNATAQAENEFNITFSCVRSGQIQEDGVAEVVAFSNTYRSETSTSDSSDYRIISTTSTPSAVFSGEYKQTLYVAESGYATTSDTEERAFLTFSEGDKELTLGIKGEVDPSSFANINNYTLKDVSIKQRMEDDSEVELGKIIVQKIP